MAVYEKCSLFIIVRKNSPTWQVKEVVAIRKRGIEHHLKIKGQSTALVRLANAYNVFHTYREAYHFQYRRMN